jgi:autotransporter-associated beta strand protein
MIGYLFTKKIARYIFIISAIVAIFSVSLVPLHTFSTGSYMDGGMITSTNFLPVEGTSMINSVTYNATAIPEGTSLKMQFSYDNVSWYSSTGVVDSWDNLSVGTNTIDLSNMGWKKAYFFYRVIFVTDGTDTPVLNSVSVAFTSFEGTFFTYSSSGTLSSTNFLPADGVASINSFGYTISSLPPNTSVQIQFSQDGNSWYSSSGVLNDFNTLSAGTNSINLAGLLWSGSLYYKTTLISSDGINTPILNNVSLSYTSNNYYWVGTNGGSWGNSANWSATTGGSDGVGVPGVDDTAIFDTGATSSAVIDTNVNVKNLKINSGYTGTITEATSSTITMSGTTTVSSGTLTLAGVNSISGGIVLNGGILNINNAGAVGTSTLIINGGLIDNTSGGAVALSTNNLQNWNGNFTFGGTNNLNLGTGAITLSATTTVTVNGVNKTLTAGGVIGGSYGLTKGGAGGLSLNGVNTYSGRTTLNAGSLNLSNSSSLGTGALYQTGGILNVYGSSSVSNYFNVTAGNVEFNNNSIFNGVMDITTGFVADFNDSSYNKGIINGAARFAYATSGTISLSGVMSYGTVTGSVKGLADNISITHLVFHDSSYSNGTTTVASSSTMKFYDTSYNSGAISILSGGTIDFYGSGVNTGRINVASGGILNFHDSSSNNGGTISVASGWAVNFYDSSFNRDSTSSVAVGGVFDFYDYSYNNGMVNGNVTFHDDISQNTGTINGSTTREYNADATTTRNFTTDGGHSDWIIIARGVVVNISNAIYNLATNIFKAFSNGFFIFGANIAGGPVIPQISISSPLVGTSTIKWAPSIDWGTGTSSCEYKIDAENYQPLNCALGGRDIPRPGGGEHTLYVKAVDVKGNLSERSIVFNYDNATPVWTACGSDLLDEVTRPYYYLASSTSETCTATVDTSLFGNAQTTASSSIAEGVGFSIGGFEGGGHNITLKNITITGTTTSNGATLTIQNATTSDVVVSGSQNGQSGGTTTVATSTTGRIFANGANGTGNGGNGGVVIIYNSDGTVTDTIVTANGGNSTDCGNGGDSGIINITNSNNYSATSVVGEGNNRTCPSSEHSSGSIISPPVVVNRPIIIPPAVSGNNNPNNTNRGNSGGSVDTKFLNMNNSLNKLNLSNLPKVGLGDIGKNFGVSKLVNPLVNMLDLQPVTGFSSLPKLKLFNKVDVLFDNSLPKSLVNISKLVPSINKELNKAGIINGYDLYMMKESPIETPTLHELAKEKVPQPTTLMFISVDGLEKKTKLSIDKKGNAYQIISVEPESYIYVNLKNKDKEVTATFNNEYVKFVKNKDGIIKLNVMTPRALGLYTLKVGTLILEVRVVNKVVEDVTGVTGDAGVIDTNGKSNANRYTVTTSTPASNMGTRTGTGEPKKLSPIIKLWNFFGGK